MGTHRKFWQNSMALAIWSSRLRETILAAACGWTALLAIVAVLGGLYVAPCATAATRPATDGRVIAGNARFTVITPTLVRLEFSTNGKFIDRRSYFAWHRNLQLPQIQTQRQSGILTITTARMKLIWRGGKNGFNARNLAIEFLNKGGEWKTWRPGDKQTGNLGGTLRSLDGCSGREPLPDGVVSRDGWYLFQDKTSLLSNGANPWIKPRPRSEIADWYFFGYGQGHYRTALEDLTTISGRIPIPPRYMLGAWRSRFYSYTAEEFKQLAIEYDLHKFPLDVMVMDMGWHTTPHGGSFDWNPQLIPHPAELLAWLHARGLHVTLNWHPNGGVGPWYSQYEEFCRAMGIDPAKQKIIPFEDANRKFMDTYFKLLMDPLEKQGVDFWWLDGGIHLGWDNALDFWHIGRASTHHRGASFSRWGGWGNQRYPIQFSGDTRSLWRVLRFEVPFTAAAGNVGADYWSHDIGGHRYAIPSSELFARWVQFGALSPVLRTHSKKDFGDYREPWYYGRRAEEASRRAYQLRSRLFPYIYTSAYLCWRHSLPLVRPLYLAHPSTEQAYHHPEEYQLGPSLLVAPIVSKGMGKAWLGAADVWFPKGTWWNLLTHERVGHGGDRPVLATANEIPVFVRGGVPLPMQLMTLRMAERPPNPLVVQVYPGASGHFTLYEDDGTSPAYLHGAYALTPLHYKNLGVKGVQVIVGPTTGRYAGQPQSRRVIIRLPVTTHPERIMADGTVVPDSANASPGYTYDAGSVTTEIRLPSTSIREPVTVRVIFKGSQSVQALLPEVVNRLGVTHRALAGAGQTLSAWKFQLNRLLLHLQTLRSRAAQEFGPVSSSEVRAGLKAADSEMAQIQTRIRQYQNKQARAAAFALSGAYLNAAVKLRKVEGGLHLNDEPRYFRSFGRLNNVEGFKTGVMLHALLPAATAGNTLDINVPGLAHREFTLPTGKHSMFVFLPISNAVQHPLYHLRGTATLQVRSGQKHLSLSRQVDVKQQLLDQWSVVGPFAPGEAPDLGDVRITSATLHKSYLGKNGKKVAWVKWQQVVGNTAHGVLRLNRAGLLPWTDLYMVYPDTHASAIAVAWVKARAPLTCRLSVRHDNGIAIWINRRRVINSPQAHGVADLSDPPPDRVRVHLDSGWNQVVVRSDQVEKDWGFSIRLGLPAGAICAQSSDPPAPQLSNR